MRFVSHIAESDYYTLYDPHCVLSQLSYIMGLYRKHRSVTEHWTEVSPIGYQALTPNSFRKHH